MEPPPPSPQTPTFLESTKRRYRELEAAGVPLDQRFTALQIHIVTTLDQVKDYQLQILDHCTHAAFLAANTVQDVRLYSAEAELDELKNPQTSLGKLVLDITLIGVFEMGVFPVLASATIIPVMGFLRHRMNKLAHKHHFFLDTTGPPRLSAIDWTFLRRNPKLLEPNADWQSSSLRLKPFQSGEYFPAEGAPPLSSFEVSERLASLDLTTTGRTYRFTKRNELWKKEPPPLIHMKTIDLPML